MTVNGSSMRAAVSASQRRDVDTDDLVAEILCEGERARRLPPCGGVHHREEYRDVRIVIDPLVAEAVVTSVPILGSYDSCRRLPSLTAGAPTRRR